MQWATLDSGAVITCVSETFVKGMLGRKALREAEVTQLKRPKYLHSFDGEGGQPRRLDTAVVLDFKFDACGGHTFTAKHLCVVVPGLARELLLGREFIHRYDMYLHTKAGKGGVAHFRKPGADAPGGECKPGTDMPVLQVVEDKGSAALVLAEGLRALAGQWFRVPARAVAAEGGGLDESYYTEVCHGALRPREVVVSGRKVEWVDLQAGGADVELAEGTVVARLYRVARRDGADGDGLVAALQPRPVRKVRAMGLYVGVGGLRHGLREPLSMWRRCWVWTAGVRRCRCMQTTPRRRARCSVTSPTLRCGRS
jgi:hypothetical protein